LSLMYLTTSDADLNIGVDTMRCPFSGWMARGRFHDSSYRIAPEPPRNVSGM